VKSLEVLVAGRARVAIQRVGSWWKANRAAAPRLFEQELSGAFELIASTPLAGEEWPSKRIPGVRRWLLPKSLHYVYYTVDEEHAVVRVRMLWYAGRGRAPKL
jgi:plasmid stabilization system protein ParE